MNEPLGLVPGAMSPNGLEPPPTVDPWLAFYDNGCRPYFRYHTCGSTYQFSLRIYFWIVFGVHLLCSFVAFAFAVRSFFPCFGRTSATSRLNLRIFTCFALASTSSMALWAYFNTDPNEYGAPAPLIIILFTISTNCLAMSTLLTVLTWAEAINNKDLKVSQNAWLDKYKPHFWIFLVERILIDGPLGPLAAANSNETYFLFFRLWLGHWVLTLILFTAAIVHFGRLMVTKLDDIGLSAAANRVRRIYVLFAGASVCTAVFTLIQLSVMEVGERSPLGFYLINPFYHVSVIACNAWFVIGRPSENELKKGANTMSSNSHHSSKSQSREP